MSSPAELTRRLKIEAQRLGFTLTGIVAATPSPHLAAYKRWLAAKMHGEMGYMARPDRQIRREDLNVILPGVKSILCVGLDYYTKRLPAAVAADPARGRLSNYAWGVDYHDVMTPRLQALATILAEMSSAPVQSKVYVDTGAILERDHAAGAGLGFTGKNTMLINPRRGSWFFLGELLTTAELLPDQLVAAYPGCGTCRRCLDDCPTNAFPTPFTLDARRCISYLTIELKGWIPDEFRKQMGNWVYGCDICQDVCPFNRFAIETEEAGFRPDQIDRAAPPLLELLALDEAGFRARFQHSPIRRLKRARFLRNVCVAAGNWGSPQAVPALIALLNDQAPLVRGHAVWALSQIATAPARQAMIDLARNESDSAVLAEIKKADLD